MNTFRYRLKSFYYAWEGLRAAYRSERNVRTHLAVFVIVVILGCVLDIDRYEWIAVVISSCAVLSAEIFNTAVEALADHVTPEHHPKIKIIKDLTAGAVLICAIMAIVVGAVVFGDKILASLVK